MRTTPLPVLISVGVHATVVSALVFWGVGTSARPVATRTAADPYLIRWVPRSEVQELPTLHEATPARPPARPRIDDEIAVEQEQVAVVSSAISKVAAAGSEATSDEQRPPDASPPAAVISIRQRPPRIEAIATKSMPQPVRPPTLAMTTVPREPTAQRIGTLVVQYPNECRRRGHEGEVVLMLWIDAEGNVSEVEIIDDAPCAHMNAAALATARTLSFEPARRHGVPVASHLKQRLLFRLDPKSPE